MNAHTCITSRSGRRMLSSPRTCTARQNAPSPLDLQCCPRDKRLPNNGTQNRGHECETLGMKTPSSLSENIETPCTTACVQGVPVIEQQHGLQRVPRVEGNSVHWVHVAFPSPSTLARRREGEDDIFVTSGEATLVHVQQPECVGRVDTYQDVVAAVKS